MVLKDKKLDLKAELPLDFRGVILPSSAYANCKKMIMENGGVSNTHIMTITG